MAFSVTQNETINGGYAWLITGDVSGCEAIEAAPGAGRHILVTAVGWEVAAGETVTVGEGETTSAVTTPLLGPVGVGSATEAAGFRMVNFPEEIQLTENTALTIDCSTSALTAMVFGRIST